MELSAAQLSALQEMSVVGMNHAAVALSQLMKRDITLKVPRVLTMDVARLPEILAAGNSWWSGFICRSSVMPGETS